MRYSIFCPIDCTLLPVKIKTAIQHIIQQLIPSRSSQPLRLHTTVNYLKETDGPDKKRSNKLGGGEIKTTGKKEHEKSDS